MLPLPTELWLLIGAYLSPHDLLTAIQVNYMFHSCLIPVLYRDFVICGGCPRTTGPFPWRNSWKPVRKMSKAQYIERTFATIKRIQCSSVLMDAIKSCTLCHFEHREPRNEATIADALEQVLQEAVTFISRLPHCSDIVVEMVHVEIRQLKQLIHHQSRPVNLTVQRCTILDGDSTHLSIDSQHQCLLKNLTIAWIKGSKQTAYEFVEWSMCRGLQSLSLRNFEPLPLFRTRWAQKSFPNLRRLELVCAYDFDCTQVLARLPVLEELCFQGHSAPLELPLTILPRLRLFEGSGYHARSIIPGRPISALHILGDHKALLNAGMDPPAASNFGSTTSILELSITGRTPAELIEHARITRLCASLQVLRLSSYFPFPTMNVNAVSVRSTYEEAGSPRGQNTFTVKYIHELYRLKHLRHLDFKFCCHVPSNRALAWERSMCEAFRTRSAPNIHHVSFSLLVEWDRVPYDTTWIPSGEGVSANLVQNPGENEWTYSLMAEAQWPEAPFPVDE